jgi:alpha-tubulin suppressor-like RCC1 family protein
MGALLLSACGASVTEVANLPNGGRVTAVVSPSRVVAGQIYTYEAKSSSGTTITWSWGDGSPDTVGSTVQKVWNRPGSQTITLSATGTSSKAAITQSVVVAGEPVSSGASHACALQAGGTVLCWGNNQNGQIGDGTTTTRIISATVTELTDAVAISTGGPHTCALKAGGSVVCWGYNNLGQLGDGTTADKSTPVAVTGLTNAVAINTGPYHTCAIKVNGNVACWGDNRYGQLGDTTQVNRTTSVIVTGLSEAVSLAMGLDHTCAAKTNGTVVCWGRNIQGQLGNGTTTDSTVTVAVTGLTDVVALSANIFSTCALKMGGSIVCWGLNADGELGNGTTATSTITVNVTGLTDAVALSGSKDVNRGGHSCAIKTSGSVVCWGDNFNAQLGSGSSGSYMTSASPVAGLTSTAAISAGWYHTCALKTNGAVACWGNNSFGQIGDGTIGAIQTSLVAVAAPDGATGLLGSAAQISSSGSHTCVLESTGSVVCWGRNGSGELGNGVTATSQITPTTVVGLGGTDTVQISTGSSGHTCALKSDGAVLCWGNNQFGQLGDGVTATSKLTPTPVVGLGTDTVQISAGFNHTCALKKSGSMLCWGENTNGQIGNGVTAISQVTPTSVIGLGGTDTVQISAGVRYTCALKSNGSVLCWGFNLSGQLGNSGALLSQVTPVPVIGLNGTDTVQISASFQHTCALKSNGNILCWGDNSAGQLGNGAATASKVSPTLVVGLGGTDTVQISVGFLSTCALKSNGNVFCWGNSGAVSSQGTPTLVSDLGGSDIVQINASANHKCALKRSGGVICWGNNGSGELGGSTNIVTSNKPRPTAVLGGTIFWR